MGTRIAIRGFGAVSPAGWGADLLASAIDSKEDLPVSEMEREGKSNPASGRHVPKPNPTPDFFRHPRLRRTGAIGRFGVAAALEALGVRRSEVESGELRTGIVFCGTNGIVDYSRRFYQQVLDDPAFASPILFPETVYNAPSSHLSALLGTPEINYTLLGDSSVFVAGLDLAAHWLSTGRVDACLVVAAEELDWLSAEAYHLFDRETPIAEGAAALFLERSDTLDEGDAELAQITGPLLYSPLYTPKVSFGDRRRKTGEMIRDELGVPTNLNEAVLIDGTLGNAGWDSVEDALWSCLDCRRSSPLQTTGFAFSVNSGWQCVLAASLLGRAAYSNAIISALGVNQQAAAALFRTV